MLAVRTFERGSTKSNGQLRSVNSVEHKINKAKIIGLSS